MDSDGQRSGVRGEDRTKPLLWRPGTKRVAAQLSDALQLPMAVSLILATARHTLSGLPG
ncbi:hypothetical protein CPCC7001_1269 [Cyanobium sp. PCC 7001]|nr:hypothetical protein CPCC7001_1269 [Cyanobium sp. PCC 7001]